MPDHETSTPECDAEAKRHAAFRDWPNCAKRLERERDALLADKARLEWIGSNLNSFRFISEGEFDIQDFRIAIDVARKQFKPMKQPLQPLQS